MIFITSIAQCSHPYSISISGRIGIDIELVTHIEY